MKITLPNQLGACGYDRGASLDNCQFGCALGELALFLDKTSDNPRSICIKFLKITGIKAAGIIVENDTCEDPFERALIFKKTLEELGHEIELVEMEI